MLWVLESRASLDESVYKGVSENECTGYCFIYY